MRSHLLGRNSPLLQRKRGKMQRKIWRQTAKNLISTARTNPTESIATADVLRTSFAEIPDSRGFSRRNAGFEHRKQSYLSNTHPALTQRTIVTAQELKPIRREILANGLASGSQNPGADNNQIGNVEFASSTKNCPELCSLRYSLDFLSPQKIPVHSGQPETGKIEIC